MIKHIIKENNLILELPESINSFQSHAYTSLIEQYSQTHDLERILIDANSMPSMNSMGFGLIMTIKKFCQERNIPILFICKNRKIINLMKLLKIEELFSIYPSLEEIPQNKLINS